MERGRKPAREKRDVGLGEWVVPSDIDPVVMARELKAVQPYEAYATEGGLLRDLQRVTGSLGKALKKRDEQSSE